MRIELPGGGWAELKEPRDLKVKDKVAVQRAIQWEQEPSDEDDNSPARQRIKIPVNAALSDELQMAMLGRVILSWSLDGTNLAPVPATTEALGDMNVEDYETLCEAITEHMKLVRRRPNRKTGTA